jgi:hypothetical protein
VATHVVTIEIDSRHQDQARRKVEKAGLLDQVTIVHGDALAKGILDHCPQLPPHFLIQIGLLAVPDTSIGSGSQTCTHRRTSLS